MTERTAPPVWRALLPLFVLVVLVLLLLLVAAQLDA